MNGTQRMKSDEQYRQVGLWGMLNSLKRDGDNQRASIAAQHGVQAANLPGFGHEIPFGNTYVSQTSTGSSALGKIAYAAVLALAAGAAGFGLSSLFQTPPKTEVVPPPVNAVLEWEIIPNGESRRSQEVSGRELNVHSGTSGNLSGDAGG